MSQTPPEPQAGATAPTPPAPAAPPTAAPPASEPPPWGAEENFDAKRAWDLIQGLRTDKDNLAKRPVMTTEQQQRLTEYDRLVAESRTDLEKAQETARAEGERAKTATSRAVRGEVKALAASAFADPEDAAAFLDLDAYVAADGEIDTARIGTDLADLLARKPHLGKPATSRVPAPNPALGSSAGGAPNLDDQIAEAQKSGDTKRAIHLQNQKLAAQPGG